MKKAFRVFSLMMILAITVLAPITAQAASEVEENFFMPSEQTISHNFFKTGATIDVAGTLEKDAVLFGNMINIDGTIKGDLFGAANTLRINGAVEGNLRFAAQTIVINGAIGRNVTIVANTITLGPEAKVGWEFLAAGNIIELNGPVGANANLAGAKIKINNEINGRLDAQGDVELTAAAKINGDVKYASERELIKSPDAQVSGSIERVEIKPAVSKSAVAMSVVTSMLVSLAGYLVVGGVLYLFAPKLLLKITQTTAEMKTFWQHFGFGLLIFIVAPIGAIIAMITIIGLPLGLIMLAVYGVAIYLAKLFFGAAVGLWIFKALKPVKQPHILLALLIGVAVVSLAQIIPFAGSLVVILSICTGLGALAEVGKMMKIESRS